MKALGPEEFARQVEAEWVHLKDGPNTITDVYTESRNDEERFIDTVRRIGLEPFKTRVYAVPSPTAA